MTTASLIRQLAEQVLSKVDSIESDELLLSGGWAGDDAAKKQVVIDRLNKNRAELIRLIGQLAAIKL